MTVRTIEGEYTHKCSNTVLRYVCRYHFGLAGVVYEAEAGLRGGKTTRLVNGVIVWGFGAIPPRAKVERTVRDTIDIIDIEKFKLALGAQLA